MTITKERRNGTLRNIGIVAGILAMLASASGVIWTFGKHSGGLDRAIENITEVKANAEKAIVEVKVDAKETKGRVREMEDAVMLIQSDISYIQSDVAKILTEVEKK